MSQIGLTNPTIRRPFILPPRGKVIQLRQNPRFIQAIQRIQPRDQLGVNTSNMPDFSNGGSYSPIINSSPGKFETIFSGALAIGSQIISAIGKNQTTQIASNKGQISALPTPYGTAGTVNTAQQQAQQQALQTTNGGVGSQAVQTGASFFDGLASSFGISTSTLMLLGIGGAYLLFRTPPKSR